MKAGSSATGSIVGSIVGIASLKNLVWQHNPMIYWGLTVLEWNGFHYYFFHKYEQSGIPEEIYDYSKKTTLTTTTKSSI